VAASEDHAKIAEGKELIAQLAKLKYEMQHDRKLSPLEDDGGEDIAAYNADLERLGNLTWYNGPWLYIECYLYRRISALFALSKLWKGYDVFAKQKNDTFKSSKRAVTELAGKLKEMDSSKSTNLNAEQEAEANRLLFLEMCDICLWGNATDLSLLTSLTFDDLQKLQGAEARKASEKNILANDLPEAYEVLKKLNTEERRVDIVLDNAGFELYVDLILATYLLSTKLATTIVLHPKNVPWFVSDVTPPDFSMLLNALSDAKTFFAEETGTGLSSEEADSMDFFFQKLVSFYQSGQIIIRSNPFWTTQYGFWHLPRAVNLYEDLKQSELVIFKGDLNYRKLTGDVRVPG
jgi:uncharacterized protein with ATP-grasp and redox domains